MDAADSQQLIRDDAYLVEMAADDPLDLARTAAVSASSWTDGGEPQVINGITRRLPGSENMWISEAGWPQRLSLVWQEPQDISLIELTLDTGLHRELRLSMSEAVAKNSIRAPQPETLRDLVLRLYRKDRVVATQKISGNYQRKLRIRFDETVMIVWSLRRWALGGDHAVF